MGVHLAGAVAIVASSLALQAAETRADPPPPEEPSFSVRQLRLGGATGRDKPSATFYVRAGKDPIKNLLLLPSDLTADDGAVIAGNQYVVAPTTVAAIDPGQAVLVTVTVGPVAASGTYQGAIRLFYQGIDPKAQIELPVEFKATPKTVLELAPHASPLVVRRRRGWPRGTGEAEPAVFCVRQKADQNGSVGIAVVGPLDTLAPGTHPLPEGAASVKIANAQAPAQGAGVRTPPAAAPNATSLPPGAWTTIEVGLTNVHLDPGTYRGAVALTADRDSVETVPLEVTVRDHWASALLVMLLGLALSSAATYMATTGSARLQNLQRIDLLRARLSRPWLLASNDAAEWLRQLELLDSETSSPAQVQARLDEIETQIARVQAASEARLKTLQGWRTELVSFNERAPSEPVLAALAASPWVRSLLERLDSLISATEEGTLSEGVVRPRFEALKEDLDQLKNLGETLLLARRDPEIQALAGQETLKQVTRWDDERLSALIAALQRKGLWPAAQQQPAAAPPIAQGMVQTGRQVEDEPKPPGWPAKVSAWFHRPRVYLRLLSTLLSLLAISLLVVTGLLTLYANKPTFGANWAVDYLGVFVWGLGSEAGRKQFSDIAPVLGALRTRLGVPAAVSAPAPGPAPSPVTPVA